MVETRGIEPLTSTLQRRIGPSVSDPLPIYRVSDQGFSVYPIRLRPLRVDGSVHLVCTWLDNLCWWRRSWRSD